MAEHQTLPATSVAALHLRLPERSPLLRFEHDSHKRLVAHALILMAASTLFYSVLLACHVHPGPAAFIVAVGVLAFNAPILSAAAAVVACAVVIMFQGDVITAGIDLFSAAAMVTACISRGDRKRELLFPRMFITGGLAAALLFAVFVDGRILVALVVFDLCLMGAFAIEKIPVDRDPKHA